MLGGFEQQFANLAPVSSGGPGHRPARDAEECERATWVQISGVILTNTKTSMEHAFLERARKRADAGRDLGEPASFLDHVYLGCTQRECQTSKDFVDNYRNMFEPKIFAGATEKLPYSVKLGANIPHGL